MIAAPSLIEEDLDLEPPTGLSHFESSLTLNAPETLRTVSLNLVAATREPALPVTKRSLPLAQDHAAILRGSSAPPRYQA